MRHKLLAVIAGVVVFMFAPIISSALSLQLELGDQNTEVSDLQTFLATDSTLYPEGLVTGYFGSLTQAAVERYQCRENIVCTGDATTTGYGRVGPLTMARINAALGFGTGGSADASAPVMSGATVSFPATRSATITWTTSEEATSRVIYANTVPFVYATAASASDPSYDLMQSVTVSNLTPGVAYYYVRESIDPSGNVMWTTPSSFIAQ